MPEWIAAAWAAIGEGIGTVAATEVGGTTIGAAAAQGTAGAVAGAALSKLLAPKIPGVKAPTPMPDQSAIDAASRRSVIQQRQRAGRQSTILSQGDGGTLG